jgi:glycosyltransferase involved in cell wall biosynthesis
VLICSNYAWTVLNFRMPLIKSLTNEGYRVVIITQFDGYEEKIANEGYEVLPLYISREGINPIVDLVTLCDLLKKMFYIKPDFFLSFTIKPVIYGSIASRILSISNIPMITGLGTVFISDNWVTKIVKLLYRVSLARALVVFFQNTDDQELFVLNHLVKTSRCQQSPGSGIDLGKFMLTDHPNKTSVTFLLIARMLRDKGVVEFVDAARYLKKKYPEASFQLLGPLGVENRTSISHSKMDEWVREGFIDYLGETDNVPFFIKEASCIVLPSYREGTSRVLLEAAAMGRPIVTTNVPGCKEIVEDSITGFLCKPKDPYDLAEKMKMIMSLTFEQRKEMGKNGRKKIENEFNQDIVSELYINVLKKYTN